MSWRLCHTFPPAHQPPATTTDPLSAGAPATCGLSVSTARPPRFTHIPSVACAEVSAPHLKFAAPARRTRSIARRHPHAYMEREPKRSPAAVSLPALSRPIGRRESAMSIPRRLSSQSATTPSYQQGLRSRAALLLLSTTSPTQDAVFADRTATIPPAKPFGKRGERTGKGSPLLQRGFLSSLRLYQSAVLPVRENLQRTIRRTSRRRGPQYSLASVSMRTRLPLLGLWMNCPLPTYRAVCSPPQNRPVLKTRMSPG